MRAHVLYIAMCSYYINNKTVKYFIDNIFLQIIDFLTFTFLLVWLLCAMIDLKGQRGKKVMMLA
jgi:hypothetical protein